ncbi:lipid-A-disaccharide synthase [Parvularcula sp. ZS-1/3]|uniref:Lipid-A-disaccharide synthase n=1 Tax=Parvularcula mediterranea TaxID=2732508 RepID=A0A7Y3W5N7_9PROT|nr:lipid-A-disaccharide synthase [Parvularcula mediterranea]NNU16688.1 lipid-A-disaccharide synthase [Parvularcula mediterranea]
MTTILLTAAEPSGDAMGASLMKALGAARDGLRFVGGGGEAMKAAGLVDPVSTDSLAVMGPVDAIAALPRAKKLANRIGLMAKKEQPDVAVLIDSWAFSKIVAKEIKRHSPHTKLVKLAVPQVWASRPERAKVAAEMFDLLLCLLPFEPQWFEQHGGKAVFVGNPNFQAAASTPRSGPGFRARYGIGDAPLLLLLPGSRQGEVKRLLPVFAEILDEVRAKTPGLRIAVITAASVEAKVKEEASKWEGDIIIVPPTERFDAFDAGDVALAASGTVTTELALTGTPMVVAYKVGPVVAYWAKRVITTPYVTVLNVAAKQEIIPERLQDDCMPAQLCADVTRLFHDDDERRKQISAFRRLLPELIGSEDPSVAATREILALIDGDDSGDLDSGAQG